MARRRRDNCFSNRAVFSRSRGLILAYSHISKALSYIERGDYEENTNDEAAKKDAVYDCLKKAQACIDGMGKTTSTAEIKHEKRLCQQVLADAQGWHLYQKWMQNIDIAKTTETDDDLDNAIQCFQGAIWHRAGAEPYYHLALAYEAKLQITADTKTIVRRHLLQLAHAQCDHANEQDCKREYRQQIKDLIARLEKLEATPTPPGADPKPTH